MARPTEPTDAPPAALSGAPPLPAPRPGLGAAVAVLLGLASVAGLWAAFTGVGPARLDAAVLGESVESRTDLLTAAAVAVTNLGSTVAMAVLAVAVGVRLWFTGRRAPVPSPILRGWTGTPWGRRAVRCRGMYLLRTGDPYFWPRTSSPAAHPAPRHRTPVKRGNAPAPPVSSGTRYIPDPHNEKCKP